MPTTRPDHHTLHSAIELANRAPSVHNTQPWRWLIGEESVHLLADRTRQLPATEPQGRDLLLSCGAALHHLAVALATLGWHATVHRIPNDNDPDHLAAIEFRPHVPSETDVALAGAITSRRTDRRRFTSWEVPADHLDLMARRAARTGALLVPVAAPEHRWLLTRAIATAARRQAEDPQYQAELHAWSGRGRTSSEGVLSASTPTFHHRHDDTTMRPFPAGTLSDAPTGRGERDDGELLVVATLQDDPASILRAGEATSIALLTATDLGMATCPLSQPLEVDDTRVAIRDQVLDNAVHPHLILRTGWAPTSAPPLPPSPFRRTEDTVGYLPGASRPDQRES
jgi:nitroreductase